MKSERYCTPWRLRNNAGPPEFDLIAAIVQGSAKLPGALCIGHPGLFDGDDPGLDAAAIAMCRRCPVLDACRRHVDGLTAHRRRQLHGVWAGQKHFHDSRGSQPAGNEKNGETA